MSFPSAILDYTSTWHRGYSRPNIFIRVEVERIIMLSLQPLTVFVKLQTCHKHIKFRVMFRLAPPSFGSEMPLIYTSYIISQVRSTKLMSSPTPPKQNIWFGNLDHRSEQTIWQTHNNFNFLLISRFYFRVLKYR